MKRIHPGTVWLSISAVVLVAVCVYPWRRGFLLDDKWMHVSSVDENGDQIGRDEWHLIPKPDKINSNGLSHIAPYVARLVNSSKKGGSLIISSPDGTKACLIMRDGSQLMLKEHVMLGSSLHVKKSYTGPDLPPEAPERAKEAALRTLFTDLGIAPDSDYVHEYNGYADAMRELEYPLGNEVSQTTRIIQRLLKEVYHVQEADGLDFTFEEGRSP